MTFLLTSDTKCTVHFEPEGAEHRLHEGDSFRIELSKEPDYFEISHSRDALMLWIENCEVRAWTKAGAELQL